MFLTTMFTLADKEVLKNYLRWICHSLICIRCWSCREFDHLYSRWHIRRIFTTDVLVLLKSRMDSRGWYFYHFHRTGPENRDICEYFVFSFFHLCYSSKRQISWKTIAAFILNRFHCSIQNFLRYVLESLWNIFVFL